MFPEEVVKKTLENTTYFYLPIEDENQRDPRKYYMCCFSGLWLLSREIEVVVSNTFSQQSRLVGEISVLNFCGDYIRLMGSIPNEEGVK